MRLLPTLERRKREVGIKKFPSLCLKIYGRDFSFVTFEEKEGKTYRYSAAASGRLYSLQRRNGIFLPLLFLLRTFGKGRTRLCIRFGHGGGFRGKRPNGRFYANFRFRPFEQAARSRRERFLGGSAHDVCGNRGRGKGGPALFFGETSRARKKEGKTSSPDRSALRGGKRFRTIFPRWSDNGRGQGRELFVLQGIAFEKLLCPNTAKKYPHSRKPCGKRE